MNQPPEARKTLPFPAKTFLFAGLAVLALFVGPSCSKKPKPVNVPPRKGTETWDRNKVKVDLPPKEQPRVAPDEYHPPESLRDHRLDMLENEWEAYRILRNISVAQKHFTRGIRPMAKDLDGDEVPEYGYLLEISGISNIQTPGGKGRACTLDSADWRWFQAKYPNGKPIFWNYPPGKPEYYWEKQDGYEFLVHRANMGKSWRINSRGIADRGGYYFVLYLPGKEKAEVASGEVPAGDSALSDARERRFCAYAWPKKPAVTGRRAFFTDRFETVWSCWNLVAGYSGLEKVPPPEAAFDKGGPNPWNLEAEPGIFFDDSPALEKVGLPSVDGEKWKIFGERKGIKRKFEKKWSLEEEIEDFKKDGGVEQPWWEGS